MMKTNTHSSTRGSALLIVFWAVMIMSVCVMGLVQYLHSDIDETIALKKDSRALQLAESGVAIGLHPLVGKADPVLQQTVAPGERFEVQLRSEGGRLNINTVIQRQQWTVLDKLFTEWGLPGDAISPVIEGFKARSYTGLVPGHTGTSNGQNQAVAGNGQIVRLFQSVDDMLTVPGMDIVAAAKPDWRNYFTIWSDGTLDMNEAPADLIAAVCGIGMRNAEQFVNVRLGPDGLPDTDDDVVFQDLEHVRSMLGMSQEQFAAIQGFLSVQDSTSRIESTGIFGAYRRKISVVVRKSVTPPIFFQWQEQ